MSISEIVIAVGDVAKAVEFYADVCNWNHVRTVEHDGQSVAELEAGHQRVTLVPSARPGVHLALHADDARHELRRLRRRGVPVADAAPLDAEGGTWVAFTDPWGNRLGFWQPDDA